MSETDRAAVERQIGRPPRAFRRVVRRCPWGQPAVTEQEPYDSGGTPFPTTYYLTCPSLVATVARLEATGGIERWSATAAEDPALSASLREATEAQKALRRRLADGTVGPDDGASLDLGIGGSSNPLQLKCLHAHVAFALARPGYLLGERITAEIEPLFPDDACCSSLRSEAWTTG